MALVVKNLPANAGDRSDAGLIPGSGRLPGGGNGNPLQYSCLGNPMDREAWWAAVHRVAKSQTRIEVTSHMHATGKEAKSSNLYECDTDMRKMYHDDIYVSIKN